MAVRLDSVITSASTPSTRRLLSTPVGAEGLPQSLLIKGLADDRRAAHASCEQLANRYSGRSIMQGQRARAAVEAISFDTLYKGLPSTIDPHF